MRHNLTLLAGALAGLLATFVPSTAHACWDGYSATVGNTTFTRATGTASWSGDDARYTTRWAARFDALVPDGVTLWIGNGFVSCEGHDACEKLGEVGSNHPQKAFQQVAKAFGVSAKAQQEALGVQQKLYTVQVFAGAKDAALKQKKLLAELDQDEALDLGDYGDFFLAGGFPGINERIHAVADEKDAKLVRVIIDEYPSLEAAEEAQKNLRARGVIGIVKELPRGRAIDAYVSSNGV